MHDLQMSLFPEELALAKDQDLFFAFNLVALEKLVHAGQTLDFFTVDAAYAVLCRVPGEEVFHRLLRVVNLKATRSSKLS